jgi:hypothetical protein
MPRPPPPLSLADVPELTEVLRSYAAPIPAAARARFYELVDCALRGEGELGIGSVSRVCAKAQREFVVTPAVDLEPPPTKERKLDARREAIFE